MRKIHTARTKKKNCREWSVLHRKGIQGRQSEMKEICSAMAHSVTIARSGRQRMRQMCHCTRRSVGHLVSSRSFVVVPFAHKLVPLSFLRKRTETPNTTENEEKWSNAVPSEDRTVHERAVQELFHDHQVMFRCCDVSRRCFFFVPLLSAPPRGVSTSPSE